MLVEVLVKVRTNRNMQFDHSQPANVDTSSINATNNPTFICSNVWFSTGTQIKKMKMAKTSSFFSLLFFVLFSFIIRSIDSSLCPMNLSYVETVPWDTSQCRGTDDGHCCMTLLSLFGMGLAQHLRETSMFQLPNATASSACLSDFEAKLTALSIRPSLVPSCFNDSQFVASTSSCAGIITRQDWMDKVGPLTELDTACKGDFSGLTRCGSCLEAGQKVNSQLTALAPNATSKCFYFTCLYAAGIVNEIGPLDANTAACTLALPLATSATKKPSNMRKDSLLKLVFGLLGAVIGVLLAFGLIFLYRKWVRKRQRNAPHQEFVNSIRASVLPNSGAKWFRLSELQRATNGFEQRSFLGQGAYGAVYKGTLADGTLVAVKKMHDLDSQGDDDEFSNEVEIISKIRHRNLLSLRGCCVASDELTGKSRYLVYDFMSNGTLFDHLSNENRRKQLTWPQRKNIILDVAKGLAYLHYGIKPSIYHRDIKATNILLDMEMKAKVADFGLAKQSLEGQSHLTTRVAGTHGYLAPEYALYGQLTEKSDVYSFGIVILEIISGRRVLDTSNSSFLLITDWAWMLAKSGKTEQIFDESIREEGPKGVMERFVLVGLLCAHVMVAFRPTIANALKMLEGDVDIPRLPERPLPLSHESFMQPLSHNSSSIRDRSIPIISSSDISIV